MVYFFELWEYFKEKKASFYEGFIRWKFEHEISDGYWQLFWRISYKRIYNSTSAHLFVSRKKVWQRSKDLISSWIPRKGIFWLALIINSFIWGRFARRMWVTYKWKLLVYQGYNMSKCNFMDKYYLNKSKKMGGRDFFERFYLNSRVHMVGLKLRKIRASNIAIFIFFIYLPVKFPLLLAWVWVYIVWTVFFSMLQPIIGVYGFGVIAILSYRLYTFVGSLDIICAGILFRLGVFFIAGVFLFFYMIEILHTEDVEEYRFYFRYFFLRLYGGVAFYSFGGFVW
uniref:hypothetical protein n=1 Tax=Polypodium hydriforme TaxID=43186 RepID=UPI00211598BB